MKNIDQLAISFISVAVISFASCVNNNSQDTGSAQSFDSAAMMNKTNRIAQNDSQAVVNAYTGSLLEKCLSDSVAAHTNNNDVKSLASFMSDAHAKINDQLKTLAGNDSINLPQGLSADDSSKIAKLVGKSPEKMDKDYADKMVSDHRDAIAMYTKYSTGCSDSTIRKWFTDGLPVLQKHLDMSIDVKNKLETMK